MRATFKVLFYVNRSKEKNGIVPIMGRVTINGTTAQFSCKRSIPMELWDTKGNCAKGKSKEAREINFALDDIKAQIIKHYQRLSDREAYVTAEMVRNAFQGIGNEYETLLGAFDKDNANFKLRCGKDRAYSSYKVFVRNRNYVADFIKSHYKRKDISMLELVPDFIKEFSIYLMTERNLKQATAWMACMQLKGVIIRAHNNGLIPRNPFANFHMRPYIEERAYLTETELKELMTHKFDNDNLTFCRDVFVFASMTALSFVDIKELTTDQIVDLNGEQWIVSKRHKTKVPYQVKLLPIPMEIIERYRHIRTGNHVFGTCNYWSMCKQLKTVIKECGIEKPISWHCARHGFATMALTNGMPIESVSRILGHTNITTTQIYAKITTEKLNTDLTALGNKLSNTFNDIKIA